MAILKSEVISRARTNLDDAGVGVYYSADDLNDSFLDVYDDVVTQTLPFEKNVDIDWVANKVYYDLYNSVPDYILPLAIFDNNQSRWLDKRDSRFFDRADYKWETRSGIPQHFTIVNYRYIAFYPHMATATSNFTLYYKYRAPELSDSDSVDISNHNDEILVDGITVDLLEQAGEYQKAQRYMDRYFSQIKTEKKLIEGRLYPDRLRRLSDTSPRSSRW
jgi:hypothetical protein